MGWMGWKVRGEWRAAPLMGFFCGACPTVAIKTTHWRPLCELGNVGSEAQYRWVAENDK